MAEQKDIIYFIIDNINRGRYLNVSVDEFYLPHKIQSQRSHLVHHVFIYGYDNSKQEIKTIGFNHENIIDRISYTYDEFENAYEKGKEYYRESGPWTSQTAVQLFFSNGFDRPYPFHVSKFLSKLYNYLHGIREDDIIYYWSIPEERVEYGFKVYDVVIAYIEKILREEVKIDYRAFHLLFEHKNAIAKRLDFIIKRYGITGRLMDLYQAYLEVVDHFKTIRLKYYDLENRFSYRTPGPEELKAAQVILERVLEMVKSGKEKERILLMEIYELLSAQKLGE